MTDPSRPVTVGRAYLMAIGALLVGLMIGLVLPAVVPALEGLRPGGSCTEIQDEYHEIRRQLSAAEGDDLRGPASALFELLEQRPECLGARDRELIEGFRTFLDEDG
jgi:hypothetical protein